MPGHIAPRHLSPFRHSETRQLHLALETEAISVAEATRVPIGRVRIMRLRATHWSQDDGEVTTHREVVVIDGYLNAYRLLRTL